jgi:predicted permease
VRPVLVYTAGRLAVLVVLAAVLWLLGLRGFWLFAVALLLSIPVSFVLLGRQRAALTDWFESRRRYREELRTKLRGEE